MSNFYHCNQLNWIEFDLVEWWTACRPHSIGRFIFAVLSVRGDNLLTCNIGMPLKRIKNCDALPPHPRACSFQSVARPNGPSLLMLLHCSGISVKKTFATIRVNQLNFRQRNRTEMEKYHRIKPTTQWPLKTFLSFIWSIKSTLNK